MEKKVLNFEGYLKEINEGIRSTNEGLRDKFASVISKASKFLKNIFGKIVPKGPKKGTPVGSYFSQKNGSIVDQVDKIYAGTEFSEMNPLPGMNESDSNVDEARVPLEYTGTDESIRNVGPTSLRSQLEKLYKAKARGSNPLPLFIYGAPGIGKTQIVAQVADSLGVDMLNLDLQFMSPEDFLGIPKVIELESPEFEGGELKSAGKGMTRPNPPTTLPAGQGKSGKGGFIFMDEANRANKRVWNSLMQFLQMGRIGTYQLPPNWVIVAAGNRESDVTGVGEVIELDYAIAARFTIVNFVPDPKEWAKWAKGKGNLQPAIVTFVEENPEIFHWLDDEKNALKFPTPRAWVDGALALQDEIADEGVEDWRSLSLDRIREIFIDSVGKDAAGKLVSYLEVIKNIPEREFEMILNDPDNASPIKRGPDFTNLCYGIYEMVLAKSERDNGGKAPLKDLYNILKYYANLGESEILTWVAARMNENPKYKGIIPTSKEASDTIQKVVKGEVSPEDKIRADIAVLVRDAIKKSM